MMPLIEFLRLSRDTGGTKEVPLPWIGGERQEAWMGTLTILGLKDT